jgi:hypothetical protein
MSSRSGAEVYESLLKGEPVSWGFNPQEKRVILTFPKMLGGETYILCIAGYYTFVAKYIESDVLGTIPIGVGKVEPVSEAVVT